MNRDFKSALSYYKTVVCRIKEYCKPLRRLDIHSFGYMKILKDKRYLHISDNSDLTIDYIEKVNQIELQNSCIKSADSNVRTLQFLDCYNKNNTKSTNTFALHNCWNGIILLKSHIDFVEFWWFGGDKKHEIPYIHANNHNLLTKFVGYFNTQAIDIINTDYSNFRITEPVEKDDFRIDDYNVENYKKTQNFLEAINLKHIKINTPQGVFKISIKEAECLRLLSRAHSIKEIASILSISPKTAETHLYNVKCRTGASSKKSLINFYKRYLVDYFD